MYDFHTHFVPNDVLNWLKENKYVLNIQWEKRSTNKEEFLNVNGKWSFELKKMFVDSSLYLQAQKEHDICHSVISPIPQLFLYDFPIEITTELSTVYNKSLTSLVVNNPYHLSALATVPLNDPEKAAGELRNAVEMGLSGAIIGPGCSGHLLSDDFFKPFWQEADRLKTIIFIHPLLAEDPRLKRRMMPNLIGVPWETTICGSDLILSGFLDRYPQVKILLAHGGGFLPYQIGRLNKGYEQWKVVSDNLAAPPIEYLRKFWYDSVLWDPTSLKYLSEIVGEDRIVPGSDFPFDLSEWPPMLNSDLGAESLLSKSIMKAQQKN